MKQYSTTEASFEQVSDQVNGMDLLNTRVHLQAPKLNDLAQNRLDFATVSRLDRNQTLNNESNATIRAEYASRFSTKLSQVTGI